MAFDEVRLRKNPACPVCGEQPTVTELVDYVQFCGLDPAETLDSSAANANLAKKKICQDARDRQHQNHDDPGNSRGRVAVWPQQNAHYQRKLDQQVDDYDRHRSKRRAAHRAAIQGSFRTGCIARVECIRNDRIRCRRPSPDLLLSLSLSIGSGRDLRIGHWRNRTMSFVNNMLQPIITSDPGCRLCFLQSSASAYSSVGSGQGCKRNVYSNMKHPAQNSRHGRAVPPPPANPRSRQAGIVRACAGRTAAGNLRIERYERLLRCNPAILVSEAGCTHLSRS
jgi:hypothetical protein